MSPAVIIREAAADGVSLVLSPACPIKAVGDQAAVNRWLPVLREHKPAILTALRATRGYGTPPGVAPLGDTKLAQQIRAMNEAVNGAGGPDPACGEPAVIAPEVRDGTCAAEDLRKHFEERSAQAALSPVAEARRRKVLALARDGKRYAIYVEDPSTDLVIMALDTPDGTCELLVPRDRYDPFLVLATVKEWEREDAEPGHSAAMALGATDLHVTTREDQR